MAHPQAKWPIWAPSPYLDRPPRCVEGTALRISYVGHASMLVQTAGLNILLDPVWSKRASPFHFAGPKRVNDPGIVFADLPPIDVVLVSHGHYDHLDLATLSRLAAVHRPRVHIAKVWDLSSYTEDSSFTKHDDALLCVAISPDGEIVASAGWDDTIWIWDRKTAKPIRALVGHKGSVLSLAFSPGGTWLASGSEDRTARLWDVEKGRHVLTFPGHADDVKSVAFSDGSDGKYQLITGDATGVVRVWNVGKIGQRQEVTTLRGHRGAVTTVSFHPNASIIASSSVDKSIIIWDIGSTRLLKRFDDQGDFVSAVAFSPDGRHVASVNKTTTVKVWNIESGEFISLSEQPDGDKMRHVAFSRDGSILVTGSEEGRIKVGAQRPASYCNHSLRTQQKFKGLISALMEHYWHHQVKMRLSNFGR
jgi:WD40 repeat protein